MSVNISSSVKTRHETPPQRFNRADSKVFLNRNAPIHLEGYNQQVDSLCLVICIHQHFKLELSLTELCIFGPMQMTELSEFILLVKKFRMVKQRKQWLEE